MKREFKGRSFTPLAAQKLASGGVLAFDLYVFLPLNARMLMIRARGQELEPALVAAYLRRGYENFYVVEGADAVPAPAPETAAPETAAEAAAVPAAVAAEAQDPAAHGEILAGRDHATDEGKILSGAAAEFEAGSIQRSELKPESAATQAGEAVVLTEAPAGESKAAAAPEPAGESKAIAGEETIITAAPAGIETASASPEQPDDEGAILIREKKAEEPEQEFSSEAVAAKAEKIQNAAGKVSERKVKGGQAPEAELIVAGGAAGEAETETEFAADAEELEEKVFDPEAAEQEAAALVKGQPEAADQSTRTVGREINVMEEELRAFSPENQEFVEEIRKIETHKPKPGEEWNVEESAARLEGMSEESKAGAKVALAIGKKLGQLRGELNNAARASPQTAEEEAEIAERKAALAAQVRELEATSMLLESLDDKDIEMGSLPEEVAGKSKLERLAHLENSLGKLAGSKLLSDADARVIAMNIKKVKARDFGVHGEGVDQTRDSLAKRRAHMLEAGIEALAEEERTTLNEEISKKVHAAKAGVTAAKELGEKRRELGEMLQRAPASKAEAKVNEARARVLQEKIVALENLTAAAEAGDAGAPAMPVDPEFELRAGEDPAAGLERIERQLENLKTEVVNANQAAVTAQQTLMGAINGQAEGEAPAPPVENAVPLAERGNPPKLARLEALARRKAELEQIAEELGAGAELDTASLEELYVGAGVAAEEAAMLRKIDSTLAEKRESLRQLLQRGKEMPKAELERAALAALAEIEGLEKLQDDVVQAKQIPAERLAAFRTGGAAADFRPEAGENPQQALARLAKHLGVEAEEVASSERETDRAQDQLRAEITAGEITALKLKTINTKPLEIEEKRVSRIMKSFLETGQGADPNEVWEINRSIAANAQLAKAEVNIAKKISELGKKLMSLAEERGGGIEQISERRVKMASLQNEIMELKKLGDSIDARGEIDYQRIRPYLEEPPALLILRGEKPTAENMGQVIKGLGQLREELLFFKSDAIQTLDRWLTVKGGLGLDSPGEAKPQHVSGEDGRQVQLGVYSAAFFRSFGYDDPELEFDLMLAVYLAPFKGEDVARAFSGRVAALHASGPGAGQEMLLRDFTQAVELARGYLQVPQVITGKLGVDEKILREFCASEQAARLDPELLVRARQGSGLPAAERDRLADMAQAARVEVSRANLPNAARAV